MRFACDTMWPDIKCTLHLVLEQKSRTGENEILFARSPAAESPAHHDFPQEFKEL